MLSNWRFNSNIHTNYTNYKQCGRDIVDIYLENRYLKQPNYANASGDFEVFPKIYRSETYALASSHYPICISRIVNFYSLRII